MRLAKTAALAALLTLNACATAPASGLATAAQTVDAGPAFKEAGAWRPAPDTPAAAGAWWTLFGDPVLNDLESRIESANPDLAIAAARYDQALAVIGQTRSQAGPQLDVGVQAGRSRVSAGRPLSAGAAATYDNRLAGASLAYELDLFGRIRNDVRASRSNAQAAQADLAAVRLALQAQLAGVYFQLREYDARIKLLGETLEAYQRVYALTDARHEGGIVSGVDVGRAQTQAANAAAELDAALAGRARSEHALAILIGQTPAAFALAPAGELGAAPGLPAVLPSTLLERRPDIVAAQHRVAAANARIGAARAAFFPTITLGAAGGYQATHGDLITSPNSYWSLGPLAVSLPILDGGARRADLRLAWAEHAEAAADYRKTALAAFQEVEDDLVTARKLVDQIGNQDRAAQAAARTRDLALERYRDGAADYLEVATAQTAALDADRALLALRGEALRLTADTVRALGGAP
jgi:multidrug efflux system outer membrane protein